MVSVLKYFDSIPERNIEIGSFGIEMIRKMSLTRNAYFKEQTSVT